MATPKRLNFTSTGDVDSDGNSPPSSFSISRRKSPRKRSAFDTVAEEKDTKSKHKKKKKLTSPLIWSEEDELSILKGLVDYRAKTGSEPRMDWDGFFNFIGGSIVAKVSKEQLLSKIRKLKRKFLVNNERINGGNDPNLTKSSDSEAFGFAMMIWGNNEDKEKQSKNGEETVKETEKSADLEPLAEKNGVDGKSQHEKTIVDETVENVIAGNENHEDDTHVGELCIVHERVTYAEPLKEKSTAAQTHFDGKPLHEEVVVDEIPENVIARKENHDAEIDADELCALHDAFETLMPQGLSDYQKKMQVEKLMNLGAEKRQELSNEWKALCAENEKLKIKKLRFSAKLAEAATGLMK